MENENVSVVNESILTSVKKRLGIVEEYEVFDEHIIMDINTVFGILNQLGLGKDYFTIQDKSSKWTDFLGDTKKLEMVKTYMYMKVRMMFDPPAGSASEAMKNAIDELEFRIQVTVDPGEETQND